MSRIRKMLIFLLPFPNLIAAIWVALKDSSALEHPGIESLLFAANMIMFFILTMFSIRYLILYGD